jgi:hypothetical protein
MDASTEVLLLHEGELADVAALLDELEVEWAQGRAAQAVAGAPALVIGTPNHLLRFRPSGQAHAAARIAVCEGASRTLESRLEGDGVDFILRRPVHPAALRLLVLHMIYRGPERRRLRRVNAALRTRYRAGWRPRSGLLLEFSVGGCSLLVDREVATGRGIRVTLPAEIGLGRKLSIKGQVMRSEPAPDGKAGERVLAIDFGDLSADAHQRLAAAVVARVRPPASEAPAARPPARPELAVGERRHQPRSHYTKAVHGQLGEQRVVLVGANLSPRGMQVDPDPRLSTGMRLKLDLYGHGSIPPLRLDARVARDDGERGLYLEFENLWPGAPAILERLVKTLPLITPGTRRGMVISEVVERS